jgi:hypothetical protein
MYFSAPYQTPAPPSPYKIRFVNCQH